MRSLWRYVIVGGAVACLFAVRGRCDDWPQWRGPQRSGISAETGWFDTWPPTAIWTQRVGQGYSSVSISQGRLYTMGWNDGMDTVYCLDAATGESLWTFSYLVSSVSYEGTRCTPTVDGDRVYTFSHWGHLYCLEKTSGAVIWSNEVSTARNGWGLAGSPLVEGDMLILNAGSAGWAFNKHTHAEAWSSGVFPKASYASPLGIDFNGGRAVALFSSSGLLLLDPTTGTTLSSFTSFKYNITCSDPVVCGDNRLFISIGYGKGCRLVDPQPSACVQIWGNNNMRNQFNSSVVLGDYLYGFDGDVDDPLSRMRCLDLADGSVAWTAGDTLAGSLVAAEGRLIVLLKDGRLGIVQATSVAYTMDGAWHDIGGGTDWWTSPALADGQIFCRRHNGDLVCLQVGFAGPPPDMDGDGMADEWENQHFGSTNAVNGGPDDDWDANGCRNLDEYVAGTCPTSAASLFRIGMSVDSDRCLVTVPTTRAHGTGYEGLTRMYRLERRSLANDETDWESAPGEPDIPGDGSVMVCTNLPGTEAAGYRARVWLAPSP